MRGAFPLARSDPLPSVSAPPTRSPPTGNGAAGFVLPGAMRRNRRSGQPATPTPAPGPSRRGTVRRRARGRAPGVGPRATSRRWTLPGHGTATNGASSAAGDAPAPSPPPRYASPGRCPVAPSARACGARAATATGASRRSRAPASPRVCSRSAATAPGGHLRDPTSTSCPGAVKNRPRLPREISRMANVDGSGWFDVRCRGSAPVSPLPDAGTGGEECDEARDPLVPQGAPRHGAVPAAP